MKPASSSAPVRRPAAGVTPGMLPGLFHVACHRLCITLSLVAACGAAGSRSSGPREPPADPPADAPGGSVTGPSGDRIEPLEDLPCSPDCELGDNLVEIGRGQGSEVVDIEVDDGLAVLCGGFGARISNVSDPARPVFLGSATSRCQRIAFGPTLADGARVLYLAHHGDSWVASPSLATYRVGAPGVAGSLTEPDVLYEGMVWRDGWLYVAAHGGGLRVYQTDAQGVPSHVATVSGMPNAWKVALMEDHAFVADVEAGLHVVSIADPTAPAVVATVAASGSPRDVEAEEGRVYLALGGAGLDVFDATDPSAPILADHIETFGSVQAVSTDGSLLALASWNHVELRDAATLGLLATQRTRDRFEQDLGVALVGHHAFVGEWEGLHVLEHREGYVSPDLWLDEEIFQFPAEEPGARAVVVYNRGPLDLEVDGIAVGDAAFSVSTTAVDVPAGEAAWFEVTYQPPTGDSSVALAFATNDADWPLVSVPILVGEDGRLDVGDALTDDFGFLDPTGAGQIGGLEGHVVVLAYFALF